MRSSSAWPGACLPSLPTSDESFIRLKRAGWSVGDMCVLTAAGPAWLVTGANGENVVEAWGATQGEAWHRACQQAQALGMLGRSQSARVAPEE